MFCVKKGGGGGRRRRREERCCVMVVITGIVDILARNSWTLWVISSVIIQVCWRGFNKGGLAEFC